MKCVRGASGGFASKDRRGWIWSRRRGLGEDALVGMYD